MLKLIDVNAQAVVCQEGWNREVERVYRIWMREMWTLWGMRWFVMRSGRWWWPRRRRWSMRRRPRRRRSMGRIWSGRSVEERAKFGQFLSKAPGVVTTTFRRAVDEIVERENLIDGEIILDVIATKDEPLFGYRVRSIVLPVWKE